MVIKVRNKNNRLFSDDQELTIIDEYLDGMTQSQLGRKYSVDSANIRHLLLRHNVTIRPKYGFDMEDAIRMYNDGSTFQEIGDKYGISSEQVRGPMVRRGVIETRKVHYTHSCNHQFFSEYTPESCYWAGFIAADGCVQNHGNRRTVSMYLSIDDKDSIQKFLTAVEATHPLLVYHHKKDMVSPGNGKFCKVKPMAGFTITSHQWVSDLHENFNITPRKSKTIQPPLGVPDDMVWHYLRGFFDGDGYAAAKKNYVIFTTASDDLAIWIGVLIDGYLTDNSGIWNVVSPASRVGTRLYKDSTPETRMDRKYQRVAAHCRRILKVDI